MAGKINLDSPLQSGELTVYKDGKSTVRSLSTAQVQELSAWLSWNRQGWFGDKGDAATGSIELELRLRRNDGTTESLSVIDDAATQKHHVFIVDKDIPAVYRGGLGFVKRHAATRPLADYELDLLHKILAVK